MNINEILKERIILEFAEKANGKNLILLDIDDTLLTANNIYIYRKLPTDKKEVKLTPDQYAKEKVTDETKKYYDYREFRDPKTVEKSITSGTPILPNLKLMDNYINKGWEVGILTARGMEEVIYRALNKWLMFKKDNKLIPIEKILARNLVHAINDRSKMYKGLTDFEKKANVIKKLSKRYKKIIFIDDDDKNLNAIKAMIKNEKIKNVEVVKAKM